ncbi:MAG: hypothetical protein R3Y43_00345 [Alphaproteobacteria bacterium]
MTNVAAIDLGSRACRLVIANNKGEYLLSETKSIELAKDMVCEMKITVDAFNRAKSYLDECANKMAEFGVKKYRAVTTAAVRQAKNGQEFVDVIKEKTGLTFEIIDEVEEARLNLVGAMAHVAGKSKYVCVFDIGGGSTEVTIATNEENPKIIQSTSIPYGARNATEKFDLGEYNEENANKFRCEISEYIKDFKLPADCLTLATSGTSLRLVAKVYNHDKYSREDSDGLILTSLQINDAVSDIYKMNREERAKTSYISEARSYIFIPACILMQTIVNELKINKLTASLLSAKDAIIRELVEND